MRREIEHARALDPTPFDDARLIVVDAAMVPDMAGVAARRDEVQRALDHLEAVGAAPEWIVGARVVNAIAAGWSGDLDGAGVHLRVARDRASGVRSQWTAAVVDRYVSVFRLALGDPADALRLAVDAADRLEAAGDPIEALGALHFAATASWSLPGADTAAILDRAERLVGTSGSVFEPLLRAERARHAVSIGAPDRAELLAVAATSLEAGGLLRTAAVTRRRLGLVHLAEGRTDLAFEQLLRAADALLALDPAAASLAVAGLAGMLGDGHPGGPPGDLVERLCAVALALRSERGTPPTADEVVELDRLVGVRGTGEAALLVAGDPVEHAAALIDAIRP